jgi:hypothetical protein
MTAGAPAYAPSRDVDSSSVGDRVVLYHRGSRTALVLNPTGSWLWEGLVASATAPDLAVRLRERFPDLTPDDAARDVGLFLDELLRHGALVPGA